MALRLRSFVAVGAVALAATAGCSGGSDHAGRTHLTVFAATSLTAAFEEIGAAFAAEHPGTDVTFSFAASSELATQLLEGAPADVFAAADERNMDRLIDADGNGSTPSVFATNSMRIVVAAGNPKGVSSLADLTDPHLLVVLCAVETPCGGYSTAILDGADLTVTPRSLEENPKAALSKVASGEADAAIVFSTDVLAAGASVAGVEIPEGSNVVARYPIAVTSRAASNPSAAAFVDFVMSARGRAILESHGFGTP